MSTTVTRMSTTVTRMSTTVTGMSTIVTRWSTTVTRCLQLRLEYHRVGRLYMYQGQIQEFKKGGSFKRVHTDRAEKFRVTTPTFAKLCPF